MPLPELSQNRHAVLALYRDRAVWIEGAAGGACIGSVPLASQAPEALARAALEARAAAGGRAVRIVLALGEAWIGLGFVALPPLTRSERRAVLARKAAAALAGPGARAPVDVLFAAAHAEPDLPPGTLAPPETGHRTLPGAGSRATPSTATEPERWLTAALVRSRLDELTRALVKAGIVPRRVVSARLAALARTAEAAEGVRIVALRDPDGAALVLCARGAVLQLGTLADAAPPVLATALLQEVRSHAACARRTLRGELVTSIELLGFEAAECEVLGPRLGAGIGVACTARPNGARALHEELLASALGRGRWNLDLFPPRIHRPRRAAFVTAAAVLLTLSIAAVTSFELARQRKALARELRELQQRSGRSEALADHTEALPALLGSLEREVAELEAGRAAAHAFGDDLARFAACVDGRARIETLALDAHALHATGCADARPLVALAALAGVRKRLLDAGASSVRIGPLAGSVRLRTSAPDTDEDAAGEAFVIDVERAP